MKNLSNIYMRLAAIWLVAGVALGIGMAASHNYVMKPVHVHINLLGWASLGLFAGFFKLWPKASKSPLARWHFWLYVPGHFVMMVSLAALFGGFPSAEPLVAIASAVVGVAIVCFAVLVWKQTTGSSAFTFDIDIGETAPAP